MVDNAFGILKKKFKELMHKSNLSVIFLPYIFTCLLHNLLKTKIGQVLNISSASLSWK
jgi:hypothetical protein